MLCVDDAGENRDVLCPPRPLCGLDGIGVGVGRGWRSGSVPDDDDRQQHYGDREACRDGSVFEGEGDEQEEGEEGGEDAELVLECGGDARSAA